MNTRKKLQLGCLCLASITLTTFVMAQSITVSTTALIKPIFNPTPPRCGTPDPPACSRPVDLVICLDTSGSMTGLINSARAKLWDIVNEITDLIPNAQLRVGLLTYGSPNYSTPAQGWIYRHSDLSTDLDSVYASMMSMSTNGGDEYVGWVLNDAVQTMSWSTDPNALKLIYVSGNESADQAAASFNFRQVGKEARRRGIVINAIFAGPNVNGLHQGWEKVAQHGGGDYFAIDQDAGTVQIHTPQDKIIIELNTKLNATYIPFGQEGRRGKDRQEKMDASASNLGQQSVASRVVVKAKAIYQNAAWDLVDAAANADFDLEKVEAEALPPVMQKMNTNERKYYVETQRGNRAKLQRQIHEAGRKREAFMRKARKDQRGQGGFDDAIRKSIRRQVTKQQTTTKQTIKKTVTQTLKQTVIKKTTPKKGS